MFIEVDLEGPPQGHALTSGRAGEEVKVQFHAFTSTEDGLNFIQKLEGLPNQILQRLPSRINPSQVDHMLAICRSDGTASVCVNKLDLRLTARAKGSVEAGQAVTKDQLADIEGLQLGVQIPDDAGILFIFSVGWRKGMFCDFGPILVANPQPRQYDVSALLGQAFCHVAFQERFSINDDEWNDLFEARWFPFIGLRDETINTLLSHVRNGWEPDEKLDDILSETKVRVPQMLQSWRNCHSFSPHIEILKSAVERFQNDDFVSCTASLFPRIEGILRTHHDSLGKQVSPSPTNLVDSAVDTIIQNPRSLLLPARFRSYLEDVYFANFDPAKPNIGVSRHSVAHGVADQSSFNKKSAVIGILIANQLSYFLGRNTNTGNQAKN